MLYIEAKILYVALSAYVEWMFSLEWLVVLLYSEFPGLFLEAYPDMFVIFFSHILQACTRIIP